MKNFIKQLHFSDHDKKTIRSIIRKHNIIPEGYDFFDLPTDFKISGDMLYHIYRSFPAYDPEDVHSASALEAVSNLKHLEREIHEFSRSRNGKAIMEAEQQKKHDARDDKIRQKLLP